MFPQTGTVLRDPLGVALVDKGDWLEAAKVLDGPLKKAGVVIGDKLTHVNGESVEGLKGSGE